MQAFSILDQTVVTRDSTPREALHNARDLAQRFVERTQVDELIVSAQIFDHEARCRSFALAAGVLNDLIDAAEPAGAEQ